MLFAISCAITWGSPKMTKSHNVLTRFVHETVHDTVQSLPEPHFEDPADNTTERWNLYLKHGLRLRIEALAQAQGIAPSRVVQEILWHALNDRSPPTP